jgi:hypothetical protein
VRTSHTHLATEVRAQRRLAQQGQRSELFDPAQAGLDVLERGGQPALLLIRGVLPIHLVDPLYEEGIEREDVLWSLAAYVAQKP